MAGNVDYAMTPRERFRADVAETLAQWRLGPGIPPRHDWRAENTIYWQGVGEIAALRLLALYLPLLKTIERIERDVALIEAIARGRSFMPSKYRKG